MRVQLNAPILARFVSPVVLLLVLTLSIGIPRAGAFPPESSPTLGNTNPQDRASVLTASAKPSWPLPLEAGMNLVSLPAPAKAWNVDELFGGTPEVALVITYEGLEPKVAVRHPDSERFVGSLDRHYYWNAYLVWADRAATVDVDFPSYYRSYKPPIPPKERRPTEGQHSAPLSYNPPLPPKEQQPIRSRQSLLSKLPSPPPALYPIGGQWNLLPVLSLYFPLDIPAGTKVDPDQYLRDFSVAFGWSSNGWIKIEPDPADDPGRLSDMEPALEIGKGYWVYYEEDTIVVPR